MSDKLYAIKDSTLTALGDAVRNKLNGTSELPIINGECASMNYRKEVPIQLPNYVKKMRITGFVSHDPGTSMWYYLAVAPGYYNDAYDASRDANRIIIDDYGDFEVELNGNALTFHTDKYSNYADSLAFTYTIIGLDGNGNEFKYTPLEMVDVINELNIIPTEALNLTGDCQYRFAYGNNDWLINMAGDKITTKDISSTAYMFQNSKVESIPFEINLKDNTGINASMFDSCVNLKEIPQVNVVITGSKEISYVFKSCYSMREIPEWFIDYLEQSYNYGKNNNFFGGPAENVFQNCYSLRKIPDRAMKALGVNGTPSGTYYTFVYSKPFSKCYCLDEVLNMPSDNYAFTSNQFSNFFGGLYRVKNITFATNEDGTPMIRNWKSQTIDLSNPIGWSNTLADIINYNSGITADKEVKDDATYQALKNDADWFSMDFNYSRYNHDSAVNTINSLPDCSASGGTNTIKFKGASGALTDGGAINTLTEAEIAVASAKGWSVALV